MNRIYFLYATVLLDAAPRLKIELEDSFVKTSVMDIERTGTITHREDCFRNINILRRKLDNPSEVVTILEDTFKMVLLEGKYYVLPVAVDSNTYILNYEPLYDHIISLLGNQVDPHTGWMVLHGINSFLSSLVNPLNYKVIDQDRRHLIVMNKKDGENLAEGYFMAIQSCSVNKQMTDVRQNVCKVQRNIRLQSELDDLFSRKEILEKQEKQFSDAKQREIERTSVCTREECQSPGVLPSDLREEVIRIKSNLQKKKDVKANERLLRIIASEIDLPMMLSDGKIKSGIQICDELLA